MHRGVDTARESLLETFWPEAEPPRARDNLSTTLSSVRRCLRAAGLPADELIVADNSVVRWAGDVTVDAERFFGLSTQDEAAASAQALSLYRGDFLEGDYDAWPASERERFAALYESLLARLVRTKRDPDAARRLIARNPYVEEAYSVLLDAEMRAGRSANAIALIDQCRSALAEVSERPSDAFEERFGHIKRRQLDVPPTNLPRQRTSFIGRDAELRDVRELVGNSQLVTIAGAGGIGKTRAALEAGANLLDAFDDGVWFADLAKVTTEESVVPEIASAFSVQSQGFGSLLDRVLSHLRRRRLLLILDNCEHVAVEASRTVDALARSCPTLTVLVTSREPLGAAGERVYRLPSLEVPPAGEELDAQTAMTFSAIALFVERARAVDASFAIGNESAAAIAEICRRLDGIALAIELAASRMNVLSAQQLLEMLRERFELPVSTNRIAHPRHRTMRAALDWSYEWLSETEKQMFRRLAIFQGGWVLEALLDPASKGSADKFVTLDLLSSLVNKSLVTVKARERSQRYRLLEPLREYGLERLKECGELDEVAQWQATYFGGVAREAAGKWGKMPELDWLMSIEEEFDNIRAAVEWSLLHHNDPHLGARIVEHLGPFWFSRHYHEGLRWLELARAAVPFDTDPTLNVAIAAALARAYGQAHSADALRVCEESIGPARQVSEEVHLRRLLFFYSWSLTTFNRLEEAEVAAIESLEKAERAGDAYRVAFNCWILARLNRRRGAFDVARRLSSRMTEVYEAMHLPLDRNRWVILTERARIEQLSGNVVRAIELCREAHSVAQLTQDPLGDVQAQYFLAIQLFMAGAIEEAREHARAVIKMARDELLPHGIAFGIQVLAGVAMLTSKQETGAQLIGYAERRFREQSLPREAFVEVDPQMFLRPLRDHFGDRRFAELAATGERLTEERAIAEALKI